ncbi:hypothetical protein L7F22_043855 [Adiantum nelumboides]|nr:hypothetical protein [Adiantum nelumboides]
MAPTPLASNGQNGQDVHELAEFTSGSEGIHTSVHSPSITTASGRRRSISYKDIESSSKRESIDNEADLDEEYVDETFQMRTTRRSDDENVPGSSRKISKNDKRGIELSDEEDDEDDEELGADAPLVGETRRQRRERRERRANTEEEGEKSSLDDPMSLIRRAVPETDDPSLPTLTFRVVFIGSFFCILGAGISQLFFYKSNSPSFSSYFVILTSLPIGKWMASALPKKRIHFWRWSFDLNPGPFSIKEHLLIAILSSSGATSAYASDIINIQELYFNQHMGIISGLTLLLTTQILGFGFAGLMHNLLVKPVSMIFPGCLVTTTMFHTLHAQKTVETKARLQFFAMAFIAIFLYQFLPALFMPTLSSMAILCFFNNQNKAFRVLSSGYKGFGLPNLSFDWNVIATSGPLYRPWWAALNFYAGLAGAMYVIMPILYFSNFWDAKSFSSPIDAGLYDPRTHQKFEVAALLKPDHTLDWGKYLERKPVLLTPWFAINYGIAFATLTSMIVYVALWHHEDVVKAIRAPFHDDIHNRLMRAYAPVPRSWYLWTLGISLTASIMLVWTTPLQLPVWGLLIAVGLSLIFLIPVGITKAVSDTTIGLNVITEFVAGVLMPGKPIANVCFKCYGYMAMSQALDLTTDMKIAHYMKIPPKDMFMSQLMGTVIGCIVNLFVVRLILNPAAGYRGFLDGSQIDPTAQWDGRKVRIFYSASIIWGAIGPIEFFSGKYRSLFWFFLWGALLPFIPWLLNKRYPRRYWKLIHFPVLLHGAGYPPQVPTNIIISGFTVSWLSQWWARRKHPKWFARRNYVLASALDAGTSVNALCIFLLSLTVLKVFPVAHWFMNPAKDSEHCTPPGEQLAPS